MRLVLRFTVAFSLLVACSGPPPVVAIAPPPPSAPAPGAGPTAVVLATEGFEHGEGKWSFGGKGYDVGIDTTERHEGQASLRLAFREAGAFGRGGLAMSADGARGKTVTLSGWLKTDAVEEGFAGLSLRAHAADGRIVAFDNMQARNIHGTTPWTRQQIVLQVPEDAAQIVFGALLTGRGKAWADDLRVEAREAAPSVPVSIDGVARDQAGKPVAGAIVALVPHAASRALATTTAGPDGHFHFSAPPGSYALTATAAGLAAGNRSMATIDATLADADVALGGSGAFTVTGTLRLAGVAPSAGAKVCATRLSDDDGALFYAVTDAAGAFALTLPPAARGYVVAVDDAASIVAPVPIHDSTDQTVALTGSLRAPAPEEVVEWVRQKAVPIATADPAHDVSDLESLGAIVGSARVVALGEATHGTREFFQLKHRVLEYLVERQGFTVFAIEASYPESLAVDAYLIHGTGDPKKALAGMHFWIWNTEEVLAQIEWMRRWNADPKHVKKVRFVGYDMQTAHVAVERVLDYLAKVDPGAAKGATATLAPLNRENEPGYDKLPEQRAATEAGVAALLALFDREKTRWSARTSPAAWAVARQHAVIITQTAHWRSSSESSNWRDESMANNARWLLGQEPRGTRMVVWAHNAHVNRVMPAAYTFTPMGAHLSRALGNDYVALGFVFDRGGFQAKEGTGRLGAFQVGEAGAGDLAEAFHRAGKLLFALDLRHPPEGVVAEWLAAPHLMRQIGAVYADEVGMNTTVVLPRLFDAVVYVDETTCARPLDGK